MSYAEELEDFVTQYAVTLVPKVHWIILNPRPTPASIIQLRARILQTDLNSLLRQGIASVIYSRNRFGRTGR